MSISKTFTVTKEVTVSVQYILAATEPTTPSGFTRTPELNVDLGQLGILWGFLKIG